MEPRGAVGHYNGRYTLYLSSQNIHGNRDMAAWKMIGYPGARYNYLDWVDRHNERFPLPPVSMAGRAEWTPKSR